MGSRNDVAERLVLRVAAARSSKRVAKNSRDVQVEERSGGEQDAKKHRHCAQGGELRISVRLRTFCMQEPIIGDACKATCDSS